MSEQEKKERLKRFSTDASDLGFDPKKFQSKPGVPKEQLEKTEKKELKK
jgi:hypothetical protein